MTLFSKIDNSAADPNGDRATSVKPGMPAEQLNIRFALSPEGRTYIAQQYVSYPFHICRPQYADEDLPGFATLYIQSCAGGLYQNDCLTALVRAGKGSEAHVTTQASTIVHSTLAGCASQHVELEAEDGSYLEYLPDPQVLFPRSRCSSTINVNNAPGGTVVLSDSFLTHDPAGAAEPFTSYAGEIRITECSGQPAAIDRLNVDGRKFASRWPGTIGRFSAHGSLVIARWGLTASSLAAFDEFASASDEAYVGVSSLPKDSGIIVRVIALDGLSLQRTMHACWVASRKLLKGSAPAPRRK